MASIFAESSAQISRKSNEVGVNQIFRENLVTGEIGDWNGESSESGVRGQLHSREAVLEERLMGAAGLEVCCSR